MAQNPVLTYTPKGIYCPDGDFYIDPTRAVDRALVTHGHSDHAYRGHAHYLCSAPALPVIRHRLGRIEAEGIAYNEPRRIGGVTVSFHPAGHVPGSAQIRVERGGEVWVASGDYKTEADPLCEPFEAVPCHTFITECTFGLPIYRWQPEAQIMADIARWWAANAAENRISVLAAYSFGKAQRLMAAIPPQGPIHTHAAVENITEILRAQGYTLPPTHRLGLSPLPRNALIIAPPNVLQGDFLGTIGPVSVGFASGWMTLAARRRGLDAAFTLSDHADWPGLNTAIRATGAAQILTTHGYTRPFRDWLTTQGYQAATL